VIHFQTIFADFYLTKTLDNIATHQPLLLILIKMEKSQYWQYCPNTDEKMGEYGDGGTEKLATQG
jgi:hypothetical protein